MVARLISHEEARANIDRNVSLLSEIVVRDDGYYRIVNNNPERDLKLRCQMSEVFIELLIGEPFDNRLASKWIYAQIPFKIQEGDVFIKGIENANKALELIKDLIYERFELQEN